MIAVVLMGHTALAENIYTLIKTGKIDEAKSQLSQLTSAQNRDGDMLFFQSLLSESGDKSAQMMEAALKTGVSATFRQEIYYHLAHYYFITGDDYKLNKIVNEYRTNWENGVYRSEMIRFSILLDEHDKKYNDAIKQADRYLMEYTAESDNQFGQIDKARIMEEFNKPVAAYNLLRTLSKENSGPCVSMALYMLAFTAIENKRTDDAVFYYNLCREGYPSAVGLDATIERMTGMSTSGDRDSKAEQRTGTTYSIQVGVFSTKDNAERFSEDFKKFGKNVEIDNKRISDKNYYVVFVGNFSSYNAALTFKKMLESNFDEAFQVKVR